MLFGSYPTWIQLGTGNTVIEFKWLIEQEFARFFLWLTCIFAEIKVQARTSFTGKGSNTSLCTKCGSMRCQMLVRQSSKENHSAILPWTVKEECGWIFLSLMNKRIWETA